MTDVINIDLNDAQWMQATLPVKDGGLGIRSVTMLAPSAFLASAAGTLQTQDSILPARLHDRVDASTANSLVAWKKLASEETPAESKQHRQKEWDKINTRKIAADLLSRANDPLDQARLRAVTEPHAGDWLLAPPIASIGLRMTDETIRVATGMRLGTHICEPHVCPCGSWVESRGTHCLSCRHSAARIARHNAINDIIWRAFQRAKIPATKEPSNLMRTDNKRPDGVTLVPWKQGKCLAWDVTMPDTYAASHLHQSATKAGQAASNAASTKTQKYEGITQTHLFTPIAIETAGVWDRQASDFINELGKRITVITGDRKESNYLFQQISVAIQRGNMLSFERSFDTEERQD